MFAVWAWQRQIREKPEETQAAKSKRLVYRVPNQKGIGEGQSRWFCRPCMKGFVIQGSGQPEICPEGHRGEPELAVPGTRPLRGPVLETECELSE